MNKEKIKVKEVKRKPSRIEEDSAIRSIEQELREKAFQKEVEENMDNNV